MEGVPMMTTQSSQPNPTMPISLAAHHRAQTLYRQQHNQKQARQVYLNALAISVVNDYVNALDIATNLDQSDSASLTIQTLMDTGVLQVANWGELECRPVLPGETACYVPPEVWRDRRGYVAVELNQELTQATLRGYLPAVTDEWVPLNHFESIATLIDVLSDVPVPAESPHPLSQWLNGMVESGWETVEMLFRDQGQPAFAFRSLRSPASQTIQRGKRIHLERGQDEVALLIELAQTPEPDLDISVQVFPQRDRILPNDLKLAILDDSGESLLQAAARDSGSLVCKFSGQPGETFAIKLKLGEFSFVEDFLI